MLHFDLIGLIASILFVSIYLPLGWKRKYSPGRVILTALIFLYFLSLIKATLFPIPLWDFGIPRKPNLIPFATSRDILANEDWRFALKNIGGNFILLMPFGFFLALKTKKRFTFFHLLAAAFLVTLCIEFLQLFISFLIDFRYRTFDVDDLALNTIGFMLVYPAGVWVRKKWKNYLGF